MPESLTIHASRHALRVALRACGLVVVAFGLVEYARRTCALVLMRSFLWLMLAVPERANVVDLCSQEGSVEVCGMHTVPWRQWGGGRCFVASIAVGELSVCRVEWGDVAGLSEGTALRVERVLESDEAVDDVHFRLVVVAPVSLCVLRCTRKQLRSICRQHGVSQSVVSLAGVQSLLRAHVCSSSCGPVRLLLSRPERIELGRKQLFGFRYHVGSSSQGQLVKGTTVRLTRDVSEAGESGGEVVAPKKYVFREPVVPLTSGPLQMLSARVGTDGYCSANVTDEPRFPPRPLPLSEKMKIVRNWVMASNAYALSEGPCAVCARNVLLTKLASVSLADECLLRLLEYTAEVTRPTDEDVDGLDRILLRDAVHLKKGCADVCKQCLVALRKNRLPDLAMANGLWLGPVPSELRALSFVEKLLVARYRHNTCVITVRGGARQMRANALVCAQPVAEFYRVLPPSPAELSGMLAIFCTGPCKLSDEEMKRAPVFVRPDVVLLALEWLKVHHCDYKDLEISYENLRMYREDKPVVDWFYHPSDGKEPLESLSVYEGAWDGVGTDGECPFVVQGLCPDEVASMNYDQRMRTAVEHLRKGGKVLGYGQSSRPESIYHNPRLYPGMFPWLFPYGLGGFENELMVTGVPRKTHIKYMLAYFDRRFQTDEYFVFLAYNQEQIRASSKGAYVLVERRNFENVVEKILGVNEDALRELAERTRQDGYSSPQNEEERQCFELLSLIDNVGGHVPGSNTRKKWQRSEIKSLIFRYGMPVFFITFAPSESASPICLYLCGEKVDLDSYVPLNTARKKRVDAAVRNPVACARFFDLVVRLFAEHVLRADTNEDGLFGRTSAYYGTVEEQCRKTLHLHMLLWIAGSLSPEEIRSRIVEAQPLFAEEIVAWLDSCVQGQCSTGPLHEVNERLVRKGRPVGDPEDRVDAWADPRVCLPSCPPDADSIEDQERWFVQLCAVTDEIVALVNVHDKRHPHGCQKPPDFQCRARFPRQLEPVTVADVASGAITLKKGEAWVNTFNVVLTYLLRCNTDVTCLLSGTSVRAVVAYVTDYITKRSLKMSTMMDVVLAVYDGKAELSSECSTRADIARKLVTKIVNAFTSRLQVGGPSVCAELLGHPDHYTNKYFKVLYWRSYVRFVEEAHTADIAERERAPLRRDPDAKDLVVLGRVGGRILGYSKLDDYVYRPEEFDRMCLYDFLRFTDVVRYRKAPVDGDDVDDLSNDEQDDNEVDGLDIPGRQRPCFRFRRGHAKRETHAVVRTSRSDGYVINFAGGLLPRRDVGDKELYCKTMLTLFCPGGWRYGRDLREDGQTWEDAFECTHFEPEHERVMRNMNLMYECQDARDDFSAQRRAAANMNPLVPFLADAEMDELDVEHGGVGDNDELGALMAPSDMQCAEGPVSASHRFQMEEMRQFIDRRYGDDDRVDVAGTEHSADPMEELRVRDSRQWKNLLAEERKKVLAKMRERLHAMSEVEDDGAGVSAVPGKFKSKNAVELLDEKQFLKKTGYDAPERGPVSSESQVADGSGREDPGGTTSYDDDRTLDAMRDLYSLNKEQYRAFTIVAKHLMYEVSEPLRMMLTGMGGTGKSRVIDALSYFLERRGESYRMIVLAPTGAAACLLGGSTYHSVLGLGRGNSSVSGCNLGRVRERLRSVELVVLDEISMVSCHDLYTISERMSMAFDVPMEAFASRHVLVGGDFTQLPPAGRWSQPLYSGSVGSLSSRMSPDSQKVSLGKALWHSFITVVILRENMRQRGSSPRDKAFRRALERMRYGACEDADVKLLDSRILGRQRLSHLQGESKFRFVPVIVPLNTHRDAINEECSWRFAKDHGKVLHEFYSVDRITSSKAGETMASILRSTRNDASRGFGGMTMMFREKLWALPPGSSDHVAGKLSLCVGMPVMLKYNEATELGVTNGAEAVVHGWVSRPLSSGRRALCTLFVRLLNPPRPVVLEGLPENVVPIAASTEKITCRLENDKSIAILREQVTVLPNFAMTDFNAQGRTRRVNVVDLRRCRGAQSVYTCLSRSSSLDDTLILDSWTHDKVMNGVRPDLLREMRELEILADITRMRWNQTLPCSVTGSNRAELVKTYQSTFGKRYVPEGVHPALDWRGLDDADLRPPVKPAQWFIVRGMKRALEDSGSSERKIMKKSKGQSTEEVKFTAMTLASSALRASHVARISKSVRLWRRRGTECDALYVDRYGSLPWDKENWSCGYDCFVRFLQHLRDCAPSAWSQLVEENEIVRDWSVWFDSFNKADIPVVAARDMLRDILHSRDEHAFRRSGPVLTAVDQLAEAIFRLSEPYGQHFKFCAHCGVVTDVRDLYSPFWSTGFNLDLRARRAEVTSGELLGSMLKEHGQLSCTRCKGRGGVKYATRFSRSPGLFVLEIPAEDTRFPRFKIDRSFTVTLTNGDVAVWDLHCVLYLGHQHFTCRLVTQERWSWFYDGMCCAGSCQVEELDQIDLTKCGSSKACLLVYAARGY